MIFCPIHQYKYHRDKTDGTSEPPTNPCLGAIKRDKNVEIKNERAPPSLGIR